MKKKMLLYCKSQSVMLPFSQKYCLESSELCEIGKTKINSHRYDVVQRFSCMQFSNFHFRDL